jgi:hypothetical protein
MEMTPPQPGEEGTPSPTMDFDHEMAPADSTPSEPTDDASEEEETDEEVDDEEETDEEVDDEEETEEEAEEGNPEAGEKKESNEAHRPLLGFSDFVNEAYGSEEYDQFGEEGFNEEGDDRFSEEESDMCPNCREPYEMGANPGEVSCGCNM